MKIKLLGKEAKRYLDIFDNYNCQIIKHHDEITKDDDIIFCLSYEKIIPEKILAYPKYGVYINHSSDLPAGRGWAPIQWSVLNKLDTITVTLFKAVSRCDAGPWFCKRKYNIEEHDSIYSLYEKDVKETKSMIIEFLNKLENNQIRLQEQEGEVTYWRRRTSDDSMLDSEKKLIDLWDHIRVCDNKNYPAYFVIKGHKVILKYKVIKE